MFEQRDIDDLLERVRDVWRQGVEVDVVRR